MRRKSSLLWLNTVSFAVAFAGWVIFGPSAKKLAAAFELSPQWAIWLKTLPILIGSVTRVPLGMATDRFGARSVFSILMIVGGASLIGESFATTAGTALVFSLLSGLLGATFVVGVQSISVNTPPEGRGFALGIFGAGNIGTAVTTLTLPLLLGFTSWNVAFRIFGALIILGGFAYAALHPPSPKAAHQRSFAEMTKPLTNFKVWVFGLFYMASFGTFIAATLILNDLYVELYGLSAATAGLVATSFTAFTSLARMPGGAYSDKYGAQKVLKYSFMVTIALLIPPLFAPPLLVMGTCIFVAGLAMGFAMSATLKAIPDEFPQSVGGVGGMVGALGGLAGFYLPVAGLWAESWMPQNIVANLVPLLAVVVLALVSTLFIRPATTKAEVVSIDRDQQPPPQNRAA